MTIQLLADVSKVPESVVTAAFFLGIFVLLYIFMIRIPMKRMRRNMEKLKREQNDTLSQDQQIRASLEEIMLEIEELSRSVNARLETKMALLEKMVTEADRRIAELQSMASLPEGVHSPSDPTRTAPKEDDRFAEIYALHDKGVSLQEISRMVGQTPGEIQLILGLRQSKKPKSGDEEVA